MKNKIFRMCLAMTVAIMCAQEIRAEKSTQRDPRSKDTRLIERKQEYKSRLESLYAERLNKWEKDFLQNREQRINKGSADLVALAKDIRNRTREDWNQVKKDPEFANKRDALIAELLSETEMRKELTEWADKLELAVKKEMLDYFQQLIAEDLGKAFDENLRGVVIKAVQSIPLEKILRENGTAEDIKKAIENAMPGVTLNEIQREVLSVATGALAGLGAAAIAGGPSNPIGASVGQIVTVASKVGAKYFFEELDRRLSGEPDANRIATGITEAMKNGTKKLREEQIKPKLDDYSDKILEYLGKIAKQTPSIS
ncbi:MAG TPA: hypothetical protein PL033_03820 [Candidatus Brocadiia bacterium]|nr:hypothetical protein [Candidatus Brocadiia bacterium]